MVRRESTYLGVQANEKKDAENDARMIFDYDNDLSGRNVVKFVSSIAREEIL